MSWFLAAVLAIVAITALAKWLLLKREISAIAGTIKRIHGRKTNEKITVLSQDKSIIELANAVNELYRDIAAERSEHNRAATELRKNMADISHDLRTPLTSILGYINLLQKDDVTDEQKLRFFSVLSAKAQSLHYLVDSLFTLTRLETGAFPLEMERVNIQDILSEELAGFYDIFTAGGQEPKIELCAMPIWVVGDKHAFSRVFQNLLQNIVKHRGRDIIISANCKDGIAEFEFSNRAEGLRQDDMQDLFRRFFTADRMRSGENTGLGLAIVKEFVEQTGGTITASLEDGRIVFTLQWKNDSI